MISNISKNYYANFSAILNSTTPHNKSRALIFLAASACLIILSVAAAYTVSLLRNRVHKKQVLADQDQQINAHVKQKFNPLQVDHKEPLPPKQQEKIPQGNITPVPLIQEEELEIEKEEKEIPIKKKKLFTFDELMTTKELTQDELFAYAEDSCRKSAQEGLALMKRAAQMGHADAMFTVGQIYRFGNRAGQTPVAKDPLQAITWLEKAAQAGSHKACGYLADMYLNGHDVVKDIPKGAQWLLLGFKKGAKTISIDRDRGRIVFGNENQAKNYLQQEFGPLKT